MASRLSDDIHAVDSFSTDSTLDVLREFGVKVTQAPFENYGRQRNDAIGSIKCRYVWQLHLDADEVLSVELVDEILGLREDSRDDAFLIPRYLRFLGRDLKGGGMSPTWHMRLFREGSARCEERLYDQHFYLVNSGPVGSLRGAMVDCIEMNLSEWTARHNRWSDAEVAEVFVRREGELKGRIEGRLAGNKIERKRFARGFYDRAPLFLRALGLFFYRYVLRLGFLDGREGFVFWFLQTLWFRFLIDAKVFERAKLELASGADK